MLTRFHRPSFWDVKSRSDRICPVEPGRHSVERREKKKSSPPQMGTNQPPLLRRLLIYSFDYHSCDLCLCMLPGRQSQDPTRTTVKAPYKKQNSQNQPKTKRNTYMHINTFRSNLRLCADQIADFVRIFRKVIPKADWQLQTFEWR